MQVVGVCGPKHLVNSECACACVCVCGGGSTRVVCVRQPCVQKDDNFACVIERVWCAVVCVRLCPKVKIWFSHHDRGSQGSCSTTQLVSRPKVSFDPRRAICMQRALRRQLNKFCVSVPGKERKGDLKPECFSHHVSDTTVAAKHTFKTPCRIEFGTRTISVQCGNRGRFSRVDLAASVEFCDHHPPPQCVRACFVCDPMRELTGGPSQISLLGKGFSLLVKAC